jgi:hypothetical protein
MILYDLYCQNYDLNGLKTVTFGVLFQFLTMFDTIIGAGAVGAGAASVYGSGSGPDQLMRLLRLRLRNTAFAVPIALIGCWSGGPHVPAKAVVPALKVECTLELHILNIKNASCILCQLCITALCSLVLLFM